MERWSSSIYQLEFQFASSLGTSQYTKFILWPFKTPAASSNLLTLQLVAPLTLLTAKICVLQVSSLICYNTPFITISNWTDQSLIRLPCPSSNEQIEDLLKAIMAARSPKQSWKDVDGVDVLPSQEVKKYLHWVRNWALEPRKPLQPGVSLAATRWRRHHRTGTLFCNSSEVFSGIWFRSPRVIFGQGYASNFTCLTLCDVDTSEGNCYG